LGNKISEKYVELVEDPPSSHRAWGCNMSLELHFHSIPRGFFFQGNMGSASDEYGEGSIRIYPEWEKIQRGL
jgi:hypothetical protein